MALSKEDKKEIKEIIIKTITPMNDKIDKHLEEIEPFLAGWKGGKVIGNVIKWIAGLIIVVGGAIAVIMNIK